MNLTRYHATARGAAAFLRGRLGALVKVCRARRRRVARHARHLQPLLKNFGALQPVLGLADGERAALQAAVDDLDDAAAMLALRDCDLCAVNNTVHVACFATVPLACCGKALCHPCIAQLVATRVRVDADASTPSPPALVVSVEYACPFCRGAFFRRIWAHALHTYDAP